VQALEAALAAAIAREDYAEAARVRDKLRFARADALQGVEAASAAFYAAFERMNARDMARAWGFGDHVSCTHPGAATIVGREQVRRCERLSWCVAEAHIHRAGAGQLGRRVFRGRQAQDPAAGRCDARHRVARLHHVR
jgi:limonene-1,2-epoxide hydrolase